MQEQLRDTFLTAAQQRYAIPATLLTAALRAIGNASLRVSSEEHKEERKAPIPPVRTLFEDAVEESGLPEELSLSEFRDIIVTIVERALDHRGAVNRSKVNWTRGDGEDNRLDVLRRIVFRLSRRKARGTLKFSIKVSKVAAAFFDAGLPASAERVREWISLFSGKKEKRPEEPDNKMMGPYSYADRRRKHQPDGQPGSKTSGTAAAVESTERAHPARSVRQSVSSMRPAKSRQVARGKAKSPAKSDTMCRKGRASGKAGAARAKADQVEGTISAASPPRKLVFPAARVPYLAAEMLLLAMLSESAMHTLVQKRTRAKTSLGETDGEGGSSSESSADDDDDEAPAQGGGPTCTMTMDAKTLRRQWLGLGSEAAYEPQLLRDGAPPVWGSTVAWSSVGMSRREWVSTMEA